MSGLPGRRTVKKAFHLPDVVHPAPCPVCKSRVRKWELRRGIIWACVHWPVCGGTLDPPEEK